TIKLWHAYHGVIFFSGANIKVLQAIQGQQIPALTESTDGGAYFSRDSTRRAPHNLYTDGERLAQGQKKYAPKVTYQLPAPGEPAVDFDLQGTGPADVFSKGHRYKATWDVSNPELPLKVVGADGKPMHLPAGLTWIHLVDPGTPIASS